MLDWRHLVESHLGRRTLGPAWEREVVDELAGHMEDRYMHAVSGGLSEEEALAMALGDVPDWTALKEEICAAKCEEADMHPLTRNFWLPGMAMFFLYFFLGRLVVSTGLQPNVVWVGPRVPMLQYAAGFPLVLYLPWLVLLSAVGALGAWWSKRRGGGILTRALSGLFPVTAHPVLLLVGFLFAFIADPQVVLLLKSAGMGMYFLCWVLIPGVGLFLGAVPFLRQGSSQAGISDA